MVEEGLEVEVVADHVIDQNVGETAGTVVLLATRAFGAAARDDGIDVVEMLTVGFDVVVGARKSALAQDRFFRSKVRTQPVAKWLAQLEHVSGAARAASGHKIVQQTEDFSMLLIDFPVTDLEAFEPHYGFE